MFETENFMNNYYYLFLHGALALSQKLKFREYRSSLLKSPQDSCGNSQETDKIEAINKVFHH